MMLSSCMLTVFLLSSLVSSQSWTEHAGKDCYAGRGAVALQPDPYSTYVTLDQCKAACVQSAACEGIVRKRSEGAGAGICYLRRAIALNQCAQDNTWTLYKVSRGGGAASGSSGFTKYGGVDCYQGRGGDPIQPDPYSNAATLQQCQAACQANSQCQGVIRRASNGNGAGICYLRRNINYGQCARDATWDLYFKAGGGGGGGGTKPNPRPRPVTPTTPDGILNAEITGNKVVIFSQTSCPWCVRAKNLFRSAGIQYKVIELDRRSDGPALRAALIRKTNLRTVPNIFINGRHIGGYSETQALQARNQLWSTVQG